MKRQFTEEQIIGILRAGLAADGIEAVIPQRKWASAIYQHDPEKYKWRHSVENFFRQVKQFRRVATRHGKTAKCFTAMIYFVSAMLGTR